MLVGDEVASDEEDGDEGTLVVGSPKAKEVDVVPEHAGAEAVAPEPEDAATNDDDIAKD